MEPRRSERVAEQAQALAAAAEALLRLTAGTAAALVRGDDAAPGGVRARLRPRGVAAGGVSKRKPRTASPAAVAAVGAAGGGGRASSGNGSSVARKQARAANVKHLQAAGLTVSHKVSFPTYARTKGKRTSLWGKRVRVRTKQGDDWSDDWEEFPSLTKAAMWLGYSLAAVHRNAWGVNESSNFDVELLDMEDDDLPGGEQWKHLTNDTWISDRGRLLDKPLGRKYDAAPRLDGYCYVKVGTNLRPLHHIVAELFLPGRKRRNQVEVDHIDGDPSNNAATNLQWVSHAQNMQLAAARRKQQDVKQSQNFGDKDAPPEEDEEWTPFVITQAMANLDARLRGHVRYDTGWQISNTGRVQDTRGYIKRPTPEPSGYRKVTINIEGEVGHFLVSRLVGWLFLGRRRTEKTQIDHIDKNKGNDRVGNLRWATPAQNRRNQG